jgi:hypothetical protein
MLYSPQTNQLCAAPVDVQMLGQQIRSRDDIVIDEEDRIATRQSSALGARGRRA